ncbi:MAG: aspartate--tRNA ligase [Candidatus Melainabacteria bacterium]|nr:MAG: aspartate--tRNA ligase [Candidatus Melainabacteria bacterium]RAI12166.1 MAG: aspartate--tRNA ligase [Candidatus Melainabacteria bacterium]
MFMQLRMKTNNCGELNLSNIDQEVTLSGWVDCVRDLGGMIFIELRDRTGFFQLVSDPQKNPEIHKVFEKIRNEYVITIKGKVTRRPEETYNEKLPTGQVEVYPEYVEILSEAKPVPFVLDDDSVSEDVRLKYRYLDIRRPQMFNNLKLRHKVVQAVRNYFDNNGFLEVETPILINTTPEGARDYLVPSRVQPGKFYALPQSPQIFKQLLMVGGVERYYQVAKCFRDEDLRADRQPEFTQIDLEMSFVEQKDIIELVEGLLVEGFKAAGVEVKPPFKQMTWQEAMDKYGSDKPDVRFGLELFDIGDIIMESEFEIVKKTLEAGGIVRGIRIPGGASYSRKEIDDITKLAVSFGAKALANIIYNEDGTAKSPVLKFVSEEQAKRIQERAGAEAGDIIFFVADKPKLVYDIMGRLRLYFGKKLNLIDESKHALLWIVDFPMFEWSDEEERFMAMHHPFTSPCLDDLDKLDSGDLGNVKSVAYDIVYNGTELGGGSVRIHSPEVQKKIFKALKLTDEDVQRKFGFMVNALQYGTPPHAGLAIGLDRWIALLCRCESIRDVMAFPKNSAAKDLMCNAPTEADYKQLRELYIKSTYNPAQHK